MAIKHKEMKKTVKKQEDYGKAASINAEERYRAYRQIVKQAFNERKATEQRAMEAYRVSIEKAGKRYHDIIEAALEKCKLITDNAWEASLEALKTSPTGETKPVRGTWPKIKENSRNFIRGTRAHTVRYFTKTKVFLKNKVGSLKVANT
ncbi:MAG: hypothetical protein JW967_00340 [Dehalococcoidales bacterium]|nr:hypothetical protein [Dehalococcoidales bacterium]